MSNRPQIVITGGGIGGLTTALALLQRGFEVSVHEQSDRLGEVGAGFQLSPNATRCLFSLGLEPAIRSLASVPQGKEIRLWNTGHTWKLFDLGAASIQTYGFPYLMMHRGDLHRILLDAVMAHGAHTVTTGSRCTRVDATATGLEVMREAGDALSADVLIAADGVHSRLREQLCGQDKPFFTGCMAWRGLIPIRNLPERFGRAVGTNWVGPGAHVITYPVRGGELLNFVGIVERSDWTVESWTTQGTSAECEQDFEHWHEDIHLLIRQIERPFKWALIGREPLSQWTHGSVTLLGDAAHPTLPFLAQGACMAIEDAIVLARCLEAHADAPRAGLQRYEQLRIERTTRIVRGSSDNAKRFHNPLLAHQEGAQDYIDREWAEDKVRSRYHWLFEYDALTVPVR